MVNQPDVITAQQVAKLLNLSVETVRRWAGLGKLRGVKFGSLWRFSRAAVLSSLNGEIQYVDNRVSARRQKELDMVSRQLSGL